MPITPAARSGKFGGRIALRCQARLRVIGGHWLLMRLMQKPVHHKPATMTSYPCFARRVKADFAKSASP
ncbi:hypothetical protein ACVIU7_005689 [Bradyrhizobium liaoningense]